MASFVEKLIEERKTNPIQEKNSDLHDISGTQENFTIDNLKEQLLHDPSLNISEINQAMATITDEEALEEAKRSAQKIVNTARGINNRATMIRYNHKNDLAIIAQEQEEEEEEQRDHSPQEEEANTNTEIETETNKEDLSPQSFVKKLISERKVTHNVNLP